MTFKNAAVLVGNGLSVAFNPQLDLRSITAEVMRRIEAADGGDVVSAMQEIAERALPEAVTSTDDFEKLIGAFGAESKTLATLETLAGLTGAKSRKLRKAIRRVASFAERVRDTGVSHVLEVICERTHANFDDAEDLHSLIDAILAEFDGSVTFGNLNYDTLLLAALMHVCEPNTMADLADGRDDRKVSVTVNDAEQIDVPGLRREASDFPPNRRVQLLHLHGSLTYWAKADGSAFGKLPREVLDDGEQWDAVRKRTTDVRPVVVLSHSRDKAAHVNEYPFSLAYEMFTGGLQAADKWIVIGYSFRDEPVNRMLGEAFSVTDGPPAVLVVTHGDLPARAQVEQAFGWTEDDGDSSSWLSIYREGANGMQDSRRWRDFISA